MREPLGQESIQALYLPADPGQRFCLYHCPVDGVPTRAVLYVHPFAEEMNKSRRMAALQARALARAGVASLQIDLYGCGDFADARWEIWRRDVAIAMDWLQMRIASPISLWGLRLGATLALDVVTTSDRVFERTVLWQPVVSGENYLTQFLRLKVASEMASGAGKTSTEALRQRLAAGEVVEIAGYTIAPELAKAIDSVVFPLALNRGSKVSWLEVVPEAGRALSASAQRVIDGWLGGGCDVSVSLVQGEAFWTTIEIAECPNLLVTTTEALAGTTR
jgi:exosortase A-associated hydrolase 2